MTLDPSALGTRTEPETRSWSSAHCLLYAVSIGAGREALAFVTENSTGVDQVVYPTLVTTRNAAMEPIWDAMGLADRSSVVHGGQRTELHRPLAVDETIAVQGVFERLYDTGKHAVVVIDHEITDPSSGSRVATCRQTLVVRGHGGFGGEPAPHGDNDMPASPPEAEILVSTAPTQALLYRLNGDRNPLHSDPTFARKVGFREPILHGLCTYGIAGRVLLHARGGGDPARFHALDARFAKPVYPGEDLVVQIWDVEGGRIAYRVLAGLERRVAVDNGLMLLRT